MKPRRRWFQYSLRSFLVLLTASAVWLGVVVNRAREQREAVNAIRAMGGIVCYDWQVRHSVDPETQRNLWSIDYNAVPPGPDWLRDLIGDEYFQDVDVVYLDKMRGDVDTFATIPHLRRFRKMSILSPPIGRDDVHSTEFKASLPAVTRLQKHVIISGPASTAAK